LADLFGGIFKGCLLSNNLAPLHHKPTFGELVGGYFKAPYLQNKLTFGRVVGRNI